MSEMLAHALDYAARGLPVFPCNPSTVKGYSKKPLTEHGFKDASTDPGKIKAWWAKWPEALIGGRLGRDAGIWAIDPDVPKEDGDADGLEAWRQLAIDKGGVPHTHAHNSPSGGLHVLFRWREDRPITNKEGSLPAGINVRGEGGYLIFPPSRLHDGRPYQMAEPFDFWTFADAPDWLFDLIETRPVRKTDVSAYVDQPNVSVTAGNHERYVAAAVERECQAVASTPRGKRNEQLNTSAFNLGTLVGAGVLDAGRATSLLIEAAKSSGLVGDDGTRSAMATIESGLTSGAKRPRKLPEPRQRRVERRLSPTGQEEAPGMGDNQQILIMEDAAALRFAATYKGKLRYDHDAGSWYEWAGTHWRRNGTGLAFHWARELARELARDEDHKTRITVGKAAFAGSVERYARADPTFAVQASGWDRDAFLLGTPGGVVDLRDGTIRLAKPEDGITKLTAVAPADTADCPTWLRFLNDSSGADAEMVRFLQQYLGYSLTGSTREHALAFVHGPGGNGKSVFCNVATGILNDYAVTASMDVFIASQSERHPTDLAMLRGARLVTASETEEGRQWAEARVKQMTGGDPITARFMRQDFFTFVPAFKLMIVGNHKPGLRNVDEAAKRRFNLVPFTRKPDRPDRLLEEKLKTEWPSILRWIVEGCLDWQKNGLVRPASVVAATEDYFEGQDVFSAWLDEECEIEAGNEWKRESSAALYAAWQTYAKQAGEFPGTRRRFSDQLQRRGFEIHKGTGGARYYLGIRLHSFVKQSQNYTNAAA